MPDSFAKSYAVLVFWFKQYLHLRAVLMISEGRFAGIWPGLRDHNASSCPHAQLLETTQMVLTPGFCDFFDHGLGEGVQSVMNIVKYRPVMY